MRGPLYYIHGNWGLGADQMLSIHYHKMLQNVAVTILRYNHNKKNDFHLLQHFHYRFNERAHEEQFNELYAKLVEY